LLPFLSPTRAQEEEGERRGASVMRDPERRGGRGGDATVGEVEEARRRWGTPAAGGAVAHLPRRERRAREREREAARPFFAREGWREGSVRWRQPDMFDEDLTVEINFANVDDLDVRRRVPN